MDDLPSLDTVLVPLSGGGLLAGVALALHHAVPKLRIVGVTMERGCAMHTSLRTSHPVQVPELPTLADALGGGIGLTTRYTLRKLQTLLGDQAGAKGATAIVLSGANIDMGLHRRIVCSDGPLDDSGGV